LHITQKVASLENIVTKVQIFALSGMGGEAKIEIHKSQQ